MNKRKGEHINSKLITVIIGLALLLGGGTVGADELQTGSQFGVVQKPVAATKKKNKISEGYVFVKGKGVALCNAYYKNLMQFHPRYIACERKFDPQFTDFKKSEWEKWDLNKHKDLAIKIKKFLVYADQFIKITDLDDEKHMIKNLEDDPFFKHDTLYFSSLDIDNDGNLDNMILYNQGRCMDMHVFSKSLIILNKEKSVIDMKKTDYLIQNPSLPHKDLRSRLASSDYNLYDVFFYKDKIYFDRWSGVGGYCKDELSVYELSHEKTKEVCKYKIMHWCK